VQTLRNALWFHVVEELDAGIEVVYWVNSHSRAIRLKGHGHQQQRKHFRGFEMFCRKCGANIPDDSQFCLKCGVVVTPAISAAPTGTAPGVAPALDLFHRKRSLDHVVPRAQSGRNSYRNLVSCCLDCNSKKGERSAEDFVRELYRQRALSAGDRKGRLHALDALAAGEAEAVASRAGDRKSHG
jgi:hypothetical protein